MGNLFFVGMGGTGAKCAEALVHMASCGGIGPESIRILLVDPDHSNGNRNRAVMAVNAYRDAQESFDETPFLRPKIEFDGAWSPFPESQADVTLRSLLGVEHAGTELDKLLFQSLFSAKQREGKKLSGGFYGDPGVGSVVFGRSVLSEGSMGDFGRALSQAANQAAAQTTLVIVGSAVGGTGASGVPTLTRRLREEVPGAANIPVAAILVLPYFTYDPPPIAGFESDMVPRAADFYYKTRMALDYYERSDFLSRVSAVYLMGEPLELAARYVGYSDSGRAQANPPDYVELFAALAAGHFGLGSTGIGVLARETKGTLDKTDLAAGGAADWISLLTALTRTGHLLNYTFCPFVERHPNSEPESLVRVAPWYANFFSASDAMNALDKPRSYLRLLLTWLGSVEHTAQSRNTPVTVELPDVRKLVEPKGDNQFELRPDSSPELAGQLAAGSGVTDSGLALRVWNRLSNPHLSRRYGDTPERRFVSTVANEVLGPAR